MTDEPVVSFMYPSEKKSKELGIPRVNVLDETEKFINDRLVPRAKSEDGLKIIADLRRMIAMYREIEGCDFNAEHVEDPDDINNLADMSEKINVPYMGPDGEPSSCYVTFSVGGIHGAEYNLELYNEHVRIFNEEQELFRKVKEKYGTASELLLTHDEKVKLRNAKPLKLTVLNTMYHNSLPQIQHLKWLKTAMLSISQNMRRQKLLNYFPRILKVKKP